MVTKSSTDDLENKFRVRLIPISSLLHGQDIDTIRANQVAFDVTPTFSESGTVEYTPNTPVHMPGSIQVYKHTNSRTFEIGARLYSRSVADAIKNMEYLQRLRAWRYPYFGQTSTLTASQATNRRSLGATYGNTQKLSPAERDNKARSRIQSEGVQLRGAPPDVLYLYAYSTASNDDRSAGPMHVNINRVPVVMTSLSITYPDDVDYIPVFTTDTRGVGSPTDRSEPFPIRIDVTVSLAETHSPREFERFDLAAYKSGRLVNF